jgi:transcriptional regulator with XRE-family HTH domain
MTSGDIIRRERERSGLSIADLSDKIGVSPKTMARYEHGHDPPAAVIKQLALVLGVSSDYLLGLPDRRPDS